MIKDNSFMKKELKQRLTAFVDPTLVKRAKVRGALEGLTISEVVEKALDVYAPKIEKGNDRHHIKVSFLNYPANNKLIPITKVIIPKHAEDLVVPR